MNSENHEICHGIMISCMEMVVKFWEHFAKVFTYTSYKPKHHQRRYVELRRNRLNLDKTLRTNSRLTLKFFMFAKNNLGSLMPNFG